MKNYYEELGISPQSSVEDIKQAYLALLKKYHPDIYSGDKEFAESQTQKLNNIYSILKDEQSRKQYDIEQGIIKEEKIVVQQSTQKQPYTRRKADYDGGIFSGLKKRCASGFSYDYSQNSDEKKNVETKQQRQPERKKRKAEQPTPKPVQKNEKTPEQKRLTKYTIAIVGGILFLLILLLIV